MEPGLMYVSQLPQTPWPGLTVPPLQLHTSFSCLESDLWELFSWAPPSRPQEKRPHALCIPSSTLLAQGQARPSPASSSLVLAISPWPRPLCQPGC